MTPCERTYKQWCPLTHINIRIWVRWIKYLRYKGVTRWSQTRTDWNSCDVYYLQRIMKLILIDFNGGLIQMFKNKGGVEKSIKSMTAELWVEKDANPTAIANATPASSVLPMCPQNTKLVNPIRKLIDWDINWETQMSMRPQINVALHQGN